MQQVPEEMERIMVGVEAYMSIRRHVSDVGVSFFEDDGESEKVMLSIELICFLLGYTIAYKICKIQYFCCLVP